MIMACFFSYSGQPKIKIYVNDQDVPKGDALVIYYKEESVQLAVTLLDDSYLRTDCRIKVQPASFKEIEPATGPSRTLDPRAKRLHLDRMKK